MFDPVSIIIPSLNPSDKLVSIVTGLIDAGFDDIIVVNDGSSGENAGPFEMIGGLTECTVLVHAENMGKGAALKTAFSFFLQNRTGKAGVITMDGDGQHLKDDVIKCAVAMSRSDTHVIMGVRDFYHPDVPKRNSMGNRTTSFALKALFDIRLRDTQTGLRGIPSRHIPLMLDIQGNRFEYETNMLLELRRRNVPFKEVEIATVYEEGSNERSHYRPFIDSIRIFARISKYAVSSVLSFLIDISVFRLSLEFLAVLFGPWTILACTAIARVISSFFNFNLNKFFVFKSKKAYSSHLWRYYMLAAVQMLVAGGALWLLSLMFNSAQAAWLLTILKIVVDTALFFLSYYIQQTWVFKNGNG